jgi:hypothetical protein
MNFSTSTPPFAFSSVEVASPALFPLDTPVSYDANGAIASRYGDHSWDLSGMSTDGTSTKTLHFHKVGAAPTSGLGGLIREQQKALMWLHMDAGKTRSWSTLISTNLALGTWCKRAADRNVSLFDLLSNPDWVTRDSKDMNRLYVDMTAGAIKTMWRHRQRLSAPADIKFEELRGILSEESKRRPGSQQTPLIPSRIYCAILVGLSDRMSRIESELESLLDAFTRDRAARCNIDRDLNLDERQAIRARELADVVERMKELGYKPAPRVSLSSFITGRIVEHQVALMLVVAAYTGMRVGEVSILPREGVLTEFDHMGSTHFELRGSTHKLNKGVKHDTTWITSHQGARAVKLAQRIARAIEPTDRTQPRTGQRALLFPTTRNPYGAMNDAPFQRGLNVLRATLCPVIEQSDIDELDQLELARSWARDDILAGNRWPLAFHQLRRSLAVYAHRSGMVSLPALKAQLQHITQEMSAYYADGFSRAVNLVFDKEHFSHEWKAAKAESSFFGYALTVLFAEEELLGQGAQRLANTIELRSRQDSLRLFEENKLFYRETPLGGCVSAEACETNPLEPIPYHCLETDCVNLVVFGKRLDHVIKFQEMAVATLERDDAGSVEHRLECGHLQALLKACARLKEGAD